MEKQTAVRETLLKEFANCSDKLFTLGIIRTDSFTGEIGEFIASKYFKLSLAGKSTKAYDGVCPKGYKYQEQLYFFTRYSRLRKPLILPAE